MLTDILNIKHPIILAPMFLVSNTEMIIEATKCGITGAIPAHNFRTTEELEQNIAYLKKECSGPFGINLIVNKSNIYYKKQLTICCKLKVDFIITSLGSPKETIEMAHKNGIKVFCDVTDVHYAKKVTELGADAIIAVNNKAGGHLGNNPAEELIPLLKKECSIPVISAGGVGDKDSLNHILNLGADGASIGSIFISSKESKVTENYKEACIKYGAKDIVVTNKLSGTNCTVINTPFVQKNGLTQNWLEQFLNNNKQLKKWFKAFTFSRGMKKLEKAAFSANYQTYWCAGESIDFVKSSLSIKEIVNQLTS